MAVVCRFNEFGNAVALKLSRRFIAQARVHARSVVPALDVSKYALLGLIAGRKVLPVGLFDFQRVPETFHWRIVKTIARTAHRLAHGLLQ